jgi:hypothetical protein
MSASFHHPRGPRHVLPAGISAKISQSTPSDRHRLQGEISSRKMVAASLTCRWLWREQALRFRRQSTSAAASIDSEGRWRTVRGHPCHGAK